MYSTPDLQVLSPLNGAVRKSTVKAIQFYLELAQMLENSDASNDNCMEKIKGVFMREYLSVEVKTNRKISIVNFQECAHWYAPNFNL